MNNTEKLLRAFIEASGYDVKEDNKTFVNGELWGVKYSFIPTTIDDVVTHSTDYKVTKRNPTKRLDVPLCKKGLSDNKLSEPNTRVGIDKLLDTRSTINGVIVMVDNVTIDQLVKNILSLSQLKDELRFIKLNDRDFSGVVSWFGDLAERQSDHYYLIFDVEVFLDD